MNTTPRFSSAVERRAKLVDLVRENGFGHQGELAEALGVSEMTVRRDARQLVSEGVVRALRGGILAIGEPELGIDFRLREHRHTETKRAIARAALEMIAPGTTVALDAGTTTLELARILRPTHPLKVITASLPAVNVLSSRREIDTIALGGTLSHELQHFTGPLALQGLRHLHADTVFLGATAIRKGAMYCNVMWDSEIKRQLIEIGEEVVLLVDSSKFSLTAIARVAPLSAVNTVIVDDLISASDLEQLTDAGVRVTTVRAAKEADDGLLSDVMEGLQ